MSHFKNSYVCPSCYCADGWHILYQIKFKRNSTAGGNMKGDDCLECQHCEELVPLRNILEYNKENKGWFRLE